LDQPSDIFYRDCSQRVLRERSLSKLHYHADKDSADEMNTHKLKTMWVNLTADQYDKEKVK
jgi:hypothetical protein